MKSNSLTRIVIRCDGGTEIGMGHVVRCMALAAMLKDNFRICFVLQETSEQVYKFIQAEDFEYFVLPRTKDFDEDLKNFKATIFKTDIVVLDGYNFKTDYQRGIKELGNKLIAIDDLHAWHHVADIVINHAGGVSPALYDKEYYTELLLGFHYVLLRPEFLELPHEVREIKQVEGVFISMGASDEHNLTLKFATALLEMNRKLFLHLMISEVNPNYQSIVQFAEKNLENVSLHKNISSQDLIRILKKCEVAICPASTISLECSAVGIALLTGYTAPNQFGILKGLREQEIAIDMGNLNLSQDKIGAIIAQQLNSTAKLNELIKNQINVFDGLSGSRIRSSILNMQKRSSND